MRRFGAPPLCAAGCEGAEHSLLRVGLCGHDSSLPKLWLCPLHGDWCVGGHRLGMLAVHHTYQGRGWQTLMAFVLEQLRQMEVGARHPVFADPDVIGLLQLAGWQLEPRQRRCASWYSP